jgi:hypothetical protein
LKKRKYVNLFWLGAMEVPIEGISFVHYHKSYIEILAPCLERKPYFKFCLLKNIIQPIRAMAVSKIRMRD